MANGEQMRIAIQTAQAEVAVKGTEGADVRHVLLAGIGYMADQFRRSEEGTIKIKLDGKKLLPIGVALGGGIVEIVRAFVGG